MEKQNEYLSRDQSGSNDGGRRPIGSLLEIIKEDLNNYGECMIPVGMLLTLPPNRPLPPASPQGRMGSSHTCHLLY